LVGGDKIIALYALFFNNLVGKLSEGLRPLFLKKVKIGVVTTPYSNGSFMDFVKNTLGFELILTKTGVKHLHPVAKKFDIGIYFEANGHGTVMYSQNINSTINSLISSAHCSSKDAQIFELLQGFLAMFNLVSLN
jgi:phosphoacetylglucosamine mutase